MDEGNKSGPTAEVGEDTYQTNRRTFEFFLIAGILALGIPIAVLLGARAGERSGAELNAAAAQAADAWPAGGR